MTSFRYDSVVLTETGLAREGGFGQRDMSNWSNTLVSGELPKNTSKRALKDHKCLINTLKPAQNTPKTHKNRPKTS